MEFLLIRSRETMKRIALSMLGVTALLAFTQTNGLACTCDLPLAKSSLSQQVKQARKQSRAVFSGKVLEIIANPQTFYVEVKLKVESSWKGNLPAEVTVFTGRGGGDCGFHFEVSESYLIYAYGSGNGSLGTNICQRTAGISGAGLDLKILGRGKLPRTR